MGLAMGIVCTMLQTSLGASYLLCIALTISVYAVTYKLYKSAYLLVVENPRAIITTGLDAYLLLWLVIWTFTYTLLVKPP